MALTLFVGDSGEYLADHARRHDSKSVLIDHNNFSQYLRSHDTNITAYTSLADLPKIDQSSSVMHDLIHLASDVYYHEPMTWSDHTKVFDHWSSKRLLEYYLWEVDRRKHNLRTDLDLRSWKDTLYLNQLPPRTTHDQILWIAGCSVSHGVGVNNDQRFGALLSQTLDRSVVWLTRSGSSIEFAADQILRSDIKADDIVIWGLTSEYRFCRWNSDKKKLDHHNPHSLETSDNRSMGTDLEQRLYISLRSVHSVINFCHKLSAKLIMLPILCTETLRLALHDCPVYHEPQYRPSWLDLGTDGIHPGPRQHQYWAEFLLEKLHA